MTWPDHRKYEVTDCYICRDSGRMGNSMVGASWWIKWDKLGRDNGKMAKGSDGSTGEYDSIF